MKPNLSIPPNPTGQQIKQALDTTFGTLGESCVSSFISVSLDAGAQKVAHGFNGTPKRWTVHNPEGPYPVHQYQASDKNFLYLYVTGGTLRCVIEVK
jgi:hypothetical protein